MKAFLLILLVVFLVFGGFICFLAYMSNSHRKYYEENKDVAYKIFREIINGELWEGERLNLIHHRRNDDEKRDGSKSDIIVFRDYLCVSENNKHVLIGVRIDPIRKNVSVENFCRRDQEEAKLWVSEDVDVFIDIYGKPNPA